MGDKRVDVLVYEHSGPYPKDACAQLLLDRSMVEENARIGWTFLKAKVVTHHQDNIDIVGDVLSCDEAPENDKPGQRSCLQREMVKTPEPAGEHSALWRWSAKARSNLTKRRRMDAGR